MNVIDATPAKTSLLFDLLSALLAFVLWGSWAFYVNHAAGFSVGIISALTQGTASFIITMVMVRVVTWLHPRVPTQNVKVVLPALATVGVTGSCLVFIHIMVGTPDIFYTVAPALSIAFVFCVFTTIKLRSRGGAK